MSQADEIADPVACAWSVWVQANMSFANRINGSFGYNKSGTAALDIFNKKKALTDAYQERMKRVTIECYDAIKVIRTYDAPDAFFCLDPPYVSSVRDTMPVIQWKISGSLLDVCANMKGKFLLRSYPEQLYSNTGISVAGKQSIMKKL